MNPTRSPLPLLAGASFLASVVTLAFSLFLLAGSAQAQMPNDKAEAEPSVPPPAQVLEGQPPRGERKFGRPGGPMGKKPGLGGGRLMDGASPKNESAGRRMDAGPGALGRWFSRMKNEEPETYKRLMKLRETDPEAFRQELHQVLVTRNAGGRPPHKGRPPHRNHGEKQEEYRALNSARRAAIDAARKNPSQANLNALRDALTNTYNVRIESQKKHVANIQKEAEELSKAISQYEANRETNIDLLMEEVLKKGIKKDSDQ